MDQKEIARLLAMPSTADLYNQPLRSGSVLPVTEYLDGPRLDLSAGIPGSIGRAFTAPARAYRGEMDLQQQIDEGANLAGWLTLGGYMAPRAAPVAGMKDRMMSTYKSLSPRDAPAESLRGITYKGRPGYRVETDEGAFSRAFDNPPTSSTMFPDVILDDVIGKAGNYNALLSNGRNSMLPGAVMSDVLRQEPRGIRAYHGSPHDFDKFDMSKIGTGEGAQAYGHGLYFADAEDVARSYKHSTTAKTSDVLLDGRSIGQNRKDYFSELDKLEAEGNWPLAQAIKEVDALATSGSMPLDAVFRDRRAWHASSPKMLAALDEAEKRLAIKPRSEGHMYEVRINADPADFLDWDKPLSQQSEKVRGAALGLRNAAARADYEKRGFPETLINEYLGNATRADKTGGQLVQGMKGANQSADFSQQLREAGIPGIRYLDQGSRGAGEGSSNYVVFDDKLIEILRKYGLLGPTAGLAAALATNDEGQLY